MSAQRPSHPPETAAAGTAVASADPSASSFPAALAPVAAEPAAVRPRPGLRYGVRMYGVRLTGGSLRKLPQPRLALERSRDRRNRAEKCQALSYIGLSNNRRQWLGVACAVCRGGLLPRYRLACRLSHTKRTGERYILTFAPGLAVAGRRLSEGPRMPAATNHRANPPSASTSTQRIISQNVCETVHHDLITHLLLRLGGRCEGLLGLVLRTRRGAV